MQLDPLVRDYRAFMDELIAAIESDGTRFYLDTSLLTWLIRLGAQARQEFIAWCASRPQNSVRIPVWAAHELQRHLIAGTIRTNLQKTVSDTHTKYDEFVRLASERADDAICRSRGYPSRSSFVGELEHSLARLNRLARVVQVDDARLQAATSEVIEFVNKHLLASDIVPITEKLSATGAFRYSHLMPPGYHDKKDENRYGDVIIWEEIIVDLLAAGQDANGNPRDAILISRDQKTDWVSAAPFVRNLRGDTQKSNREEELDVTLPHPLLAHEFVLRARGNRFFITQPAFLASVIDFGARRAGKPSGVAEWLASAHRPGILPRLASSNLPDDVALPESRSSQVPVAASQAPGGPSHHDMSGTIVSKDDAKDDDIATASVAETMTPLVAAEVRTYQGSIPPARSQLLTGWINEVKEGNLSAYKFGRILAELATTGTPGWLESLSALVEQLSDGIESAKLNAVVLSLISSVYFDQYGELGRVPNIELGSVLVALELSERLRPAFDTLRRFLTEANAMLPYLPGSGRAPVKFVIALGQGTQNSPRNIQDIRVGQQSALSDPLPADNPRTLTKLLGRTPAQGCTGGEIRALIAREYLIPIDLLNAELDNKRVAWSPDAGLVSLDTESDGGLSALADEDNGHD